LADELIAVAAGNVDALNTGGVALCGLAVLGDMSRAGDATEDHLARGHYRRAAVAG
jgi:hypothetical protein